MNEFNTVVLMYMSRHIYIYIYIYFFSSGTALNTAVSSVNIYFGKYAYLNENFTFQQHTKQGKTFSDFSLV